MISNRTTSTINNTVSSLTIIQQLGAMKDQENVRFVLQQEVQDALQSPSVKLNAWLTPNVVMMEHVLHVIPGQIPTVLMSRVNVMTMLAHRKSSDATIIQINAVSVQVAHHTVCLNRNVWIIVEEAEQYTSATTRVDNALNA